MVRRINDRLVDKEVKIQLTEGAKEYIVDKGYDPVYGARPLNRYLKKHVETLAARMILGGQVKAGDTILIDREEDDLKGSIIHEEESARITG
jgi:ATP-dependent Clp protease ATP-binding subunit ClpB